MRNWREITEGAGVSGDFGVQSEDELNTNTVASSVAGSQLICVQFFFYIGCSGQISKDCTSDVGQSFCNALCLDTPSLSFNFFCQFSCV